VNWLTFALASWILMGLELGLKDRLAIGASGVAPTFVLPLAVFVAAAAPARIAIGAAMILGLIIDLTGPVPLQNGGLVTIAGPHALGFALGAQVVVLLRGMMLTRSVLTLAVLTMIAGTLAAIVVVALHTARAAYDPIAWRPLSQLGVRLLSAAYTGAAAIALGLVLMPLAPLFQFDVLHGRRAYR